MYKKPKYTKPLSYSTISKYDSYQDQNCIQEPVVYNDIPLVFQSLGVPPLINQISDQQVKYTQPPRYDRY